MLGTLKVLQCVRKSGIVDGENQLHVFCDASEVRYRAIAYVRILSNASLIL